MYHSRLLMLAAALSVAVPLALWAIRTSGHTSSFASRPAPISSGALSMGQAPGALAAPASAAPRPRAVHYGFDGGVVRDLEGQLALKARSAAGGALSTVEHGGGLAVRFPAPCAKYGAESCPRAILQSGPADFLNPGVAAFSYGAAVLMTPSETSKGANVVQKGFSVNDSQFKLQVDGLAGYPTCVVVGTSSSTIYVAQSSQTVADSRWHSVVCSRRDAVLSISVDGKTLGQRAIPAGLSIKNSNPVCIGGKGTSPNNDQFAGVIDDVFVTK